MTTSALDASVLVLNRFYAAIHIITARKAFCLLAKSVAEIITVEDNRFANYDLETWLDVSRLKAESGLRDGDSDWIRTVSLDIEVPKVIRLLAYDRLPDQTVRFNRRNLFARDGNRCQYCGKSFPTSELSLDHVIPRSRGGKHTWENLVSACRSCNHRKGGKTLEDARMVLRRTPHQPRASSYLVFHQYLHTFAEWRKFIPEWELKDFPSARLEMGAASS